VLQAEDQEVNYFLFFTLVICERSLSGIGSFGLNGASGAFTSPIPWRKAGVRHNHNEILFDGVEDMRAIVGKYARNSYLPVSLFTTVQHTGTARR